MGLFTKKRISIGLNIGGTSIEAVEIGRNAQVRSYGRIRTDSALVGDGGAMDPLILGDLIMQVLNKSIPDYQKLFKKGFLNGVTMDVHVSIPESSSYVAHFDQPVEEDRVGFEKKIQSLASGLVPFSFDNLYWDYDVLHIPEDSTSVPHARVVFVGAQKKLIDSILEALRIAKLQVATIENEASALKRALVSTEDENTSLIMDMGIFRTNYTVLFAGSIPFSSSTVSFGGSDISKYVATSQGVSMEDIEMYKKEYNLFEEILGDDEVITPLITEIKNIDAVLLEKGREAISKITLVGGPALTPGLVEYISQQVGKKVVLANPLGTDGGGEELDVLYSHAYGSALRCDTQYANNLDLARDKKNKELLYSKWWGYK